MRISDWSSDVCSSDLSGSGAGQQAGHFAHLGCAGLADGQAVGALELFVEVGESGLGSGGAEFALGDVGFGLALGDGLDVRDVVLGRVGGLPGGGLLLADVRDLREVLRYRAVRSDERRVGK